MARFTLAFLLLCAVSAVSTASVRQAAVSDVDGTYYAAFQLDPACPEMVTIADTEETTPDGLEVGVGRTNVSSIMEDGVACSGDTMFTVPEATLRVPEDLAALGFADLSGRILANGPANATIFGDSDLAQTLVGFDNAGRVCGSNAYNTNTFYFFINEEEDQNITIALQGGDNTTTIPSEERGLFITTDDSRLCILVTNSSTAESSNGEGPAGTGSTSPTPGGTSETDGSGTNSSSEDDDGSTCFPASATVELSSGATISIDKLDIGDSVKTGPNTYSDVILFTHRDADVLSRFVKLTTASGSEITLTPSHYLPRMDPSSSEIILVAAGEVRVGDALILGSADGISSRVVAIEEGVLAKGLYNPQTVHGNIVVDGVVASTYTRAIHPHFAHAALSPLRWIYGLANPTFFRTVCGQLFTYGSEKLAGLAPSGPAKLQI